MGNLTASSHPDSPPPHLPSMGGGVLRIWLTRPEADSAALAEELAAHGIESLIAPVMRIEHHRLGPPPKQPHAILLTSRHAAHALAALPEAWRALPLFAVGAATAAAARAAGFAHVTQGDGGVLDLLPALAHALDTKNKLLYLAGEDIRADIAALLGSRGIRVQQVTAYRAAAIAAPPPGLLDALAQQRIAAAAFFSPRSAALACAMLRQHGVSQAALAMDACCLSLAVAQAAAELPWRNLRTCAVPTRAAMVELIVSLLRQEVL